MSESGVEPVNAAQIEHWNGDGGARWLANLDRVQYQLEPLGRRAMDRAGFRPGERVLDIGCGTGNTTFEIAARVGPEGAVTGIDVSLPLLAVARERLEKSGAGNVFFLEADAQTASFPSGGADCVFSRFGVMFFADSVAAFRNLYGALRPDGRLAFVCWRAVAENEWVATPMAAASRHLPPVPPPDPDAPGPFAFANPDRVRNILSEAGFRDVALEPVDLEMGGRSLDEAVATLTGVGPLGNALSQADAALREKVVSSVREALAPFETLEGVRLRSAAWIVTARR
ncbi:MAG: methyltransferase domain-containing protein [Rhodospirillales bacterium]|nr:methyltransferase domain-containing protein [Rhodospirillales bacterium]